MAKMLSYGVKYHEYCYIQMGYVDAQEKSTTHTTVKLFKPCSYHYSVIFKPGFVKLPFVQKVSIYACVRVFVHPQAIKC